MKILREQVVTVKKGKLMMVFRFYCDKGKAFEDKNKLSSIILLIF